MFFLFAAEKKQRRERLLKAKEDENPTDVPRRVDPSTRSRTRSNNALSSAPGCSPQKQRARARDENRTVLLRNILIFWGGEGWGMKRWGSKVKGQFLSLSFRGDKWPAAEVKKKNIDRVDLPAVSAGKFQLAASRRRLCAGSLRASPPLLNLRKVYPPILSSDRANNLLLEL